MWRVVAQSDTKCVLLAFLKKKTQSASRLGTGFIKNPTWNLVWNWTRTRPSYFKITKNPFYIYIYRERERYKQTITLISAHASPSQKHTHSHSIASLTHSVSHLTVTRLCLPHSQASLAQSLCLSPPVWSLLLLNFFFLTHTLAMVPAPASYLSLSWFAVWFPRKLVGKIEVDAKFWIIFWFPIWVLICFLWVFSNFLWYSFVFLRNAGRSSLEDCTKRQALVSLSL